MYFGLPCFVVWITVLCNIGQCIAKQSGGCFPLYVYRNCTSNVCPIEKHQYNNVYQYHRTPQTVNVNLTCEKMEKIAIKQVRYLLPKTRTFYCKFAEQNENPEKCTRNSKCTCCANKSIIKEKNQCTYDIDMTSKKHWMNQCEGQHKCSLTVPRRKLHCKDLDYSCEVPSGDPGSRCFARWVEVRYSCESTTGKTMTKMVEMKRHMKTSGVFTTINTGNSSHDNAIIVKPTVGLFSKKNILGLVIVAVTVFFSLIVIATVVSVFCIRHRKGSYIKRKPQSKTSPHAAYYSDKSCVETVKCNISRCDSSVSDMTHPIYHVYDDTIISETEENAYNEIGEIATESYGSESFKSKKTKKKNKDLQNQCIKVDHKKPDVIELTENAYYETIELANQDSCNKDDINEDNSCSYSKPNKKRKLQKLFQNNDESKKLVYDYAYQHFELEGRKRSPKNN